MEASRKVPRVTNEEEKKGDIALDAELWGNLQNHIPLQTVYEKLSPNDLFQLRLVCKAWNHGALQRLLPKPSFVLLLMGSDPYERRYLDGILSYDVVSCRFGFKRRRFPFTWLHDKPSFRNHSVKPQPHPCETEGLILCHNPNDCMQRGVFNVHTQTWYVIPPPPPPRCVSFSVCGLMVDTSLKPYNFKLIEGNLDFNTRIYDSKTRLWSTTSSRLLQTAERTDFASFQDTCICNNGHIYISHRNQFCRLRCMILKYSMEDDLWTTLEFPKSRWESGDNPRPDNSLGVWEGRIFTTGENCKEQRLTVWELVDSEKQVWEEYAHTTKEEYGWLWDCDLGRNSGPGFYKEMCLRSFFRDGYLLVVMWRWSIDRVDALAMFNFATKKWQKVRLPMGTMQFIANRSGRN